MNIMITGVRALQASPTTESKLDKPKTGQILYGYVLPFSLLTPVMVIIAGQKLGPFDKVLLNQHIYLLGLLLFVSQIICLPLIAWLVKNLATMVSIIPNFRDSLLVMVISATPFWLVSVCFLVPNLQFNMLMYGLAAVSASILVYFGVKNIFKLKARGARLMLSGAIVALASLAFGIIFIGTLIVWDYLQHQA
jgi:hypothetical protein